MITKEKLEELRKYYDEFNTKLWLIQKEFEENELIEIARQRIIGKIELIDELLKAIDDEDR